MLGEEWRCEELYDLYRVPILELVKREFAVYKKSLIFYYIVFLMPFTIYVVSDIPLIYKIGGLGIYAATLLFLHWIIIRNTKEYRNFIDAITHNDIYTLKKYNFTESMLTYLKKLCIFLAEQDFKNAEILMSSMGFKLSVDRNMSHKNKKFKVVFKDIRKNLKICSQNIGKC